MGYDPEKEARRDLSIHLADSIGRKEYFRAQHCQVPKKPSFEENLLFLLENGLITPDQVANPSVTSD